MHAGRRVHAGWQRLLVSQRSIPEVGLSDFFGSQERDVVSSGSGSGSGSRGGGGGGGCGGRGVGASPLHRRFAVEERRFVDAFPRNAM